MSLKGIAEETVEICERGEYVAPSGKRVAIRELIDAAVRGTNLYRPADYASLPVSAGGAAPKIEVTGETTGAAARRVPDAVALNYASAKNAGGGFLRGARAQEEDLARCSALYHCLITQPDYYASNRAMKSLIYTDHIIYSPRVPFFRDDQLELIEEPYTVS